MLTSSIEPTGRHILLTLLSFSDAATAEIPPAHVPSFTDLERATGYSRSTLIEWMKALGEALWFSRFTAEGEHKQSIRLTEGRADATRPKRSRAAKAVDAPYRLAVRTDAEAIPPGGIARTAWRYRAIPPGGTPADPHLLKENSPTESSNPTDLDHAATSAADPNDGFAGVDFGPRVPKQPKAKRTKPKTAPTEETLGQKVNRVARLYTDKVKLVDFHGVRQAVDAAFKSGDYTEAEITEAIKGLTERRDPVTRNSLRIAIEGQPSWAAARNGGGYTSNGSGSQDRKRSTYHQLRDSRAPGRDYKEKL